jgi:hypothetical protein
MAFEFEKEKKFGMERQQDRPVFGVVFQEDLDWSQILEGQ